MFWGVFWGVFLEGRSIDPDGQVHRPRGAGPSTQWGSGVGPMGRWTSVFTKEIDRSIDPVGQVHQLSGAAASTQWGRSIGPVGQWGWSSGEWGETLGGAAFDVVRGTCSNGVVAKMSNIALGRHP